MLKRSLKKNLKKYAMYGTSGDAKDETTAGRNVTMTGMDKV
jgi:hypothetical protein